MPLTESSKAEADTRAILARLRTGWRPSRRDLAGTDVLERWRLFSPGPYLLQGWVGMTLKSGIVFAFDPAWVRFIDRWARLGKPALAQPLPSNDAVMRCATAALAGRDCAAGIGAAVRALAERSRDAGLDAAGYLLDMAALEIDAARGAAERVTPREAGSP
jgi:hypothetical protein